MLVKRLMGFEPLGIEWQTTKELECIAAEPLERCGVVDRSAVVNEARSDRVRLLNIADNSPTRVNVLTNQERQPFGDVVLQRLTIITQ